MTELNFLLEQNNMGMSDDDKECCGMFNL